MPIYRVSDSDIIPRVYEAKDEDKAVLSCIRDRVYGQTLAEFAEQKGVTVEEARSSFAVAKIAEALPSEGDLRVICQHGRFEIWEDGDDGILTRFEANTSIESLKVALRAFSEGRSLGKREGENGLRWDLKKLLKID
jgi:hypothetical protein